MAMVLARGWALISFNDKPSVAAEIAPAFRNSRRVWLAVW